MAFSVSVCNRHSKSCQWNSMHRGFLNWKYKPSWSSTGFLLPDAPLTRRATLVALAACTALAGCRRAAPLEHRIPLELDGGWKRAHVERLPKNRLPGHVADAVRARYTGSSNMGVDVYRMHSQSSAFEAVQRWRSTPGKSATWRNDLFVVFSYDDPIQFKAFSRAFLAHLR
jgi:hypothetical protein